MEKLALLFPGQGSQYVGMGDKICKRYEVAKEVFAEASEALSIDLRELSNGSVNEITLTYNAQPLILTTSIAMYKAYKEEFDVDPSMMVGHSLGEISALTAAEAISLKDAVKIARKRGRFMQQVVADFEGAMLAVQTRDIKMLEEICEIVDTSLGKVEVANYNSKVQTVISGDKTAVKEIEQQLASQNIKTSMLAVSAPFHSIYMKPAADLLKEELSKYQFNTPKVPVLSSATLCQYVNGAEIIDTLTQQLYKPVEWVRAMKSLYGSNITYCAEIGPGKVLKNLMKSNIANIPVFSFDYEQEVDNLKKHIENSYVPFLTRSMGIAVATKNNNLNEEEYYEGVVLPYNKISALAETIENEGRKATREEMEQAIQMLSSVFKTKQTPFEEQKRRFENLFIETGTKKEFADFELSY